jgi:import receptor subunit TOM70
MTSTGATSIQPVHSIAANSSGPASTSLWTRLSGYISEHKAVVYTVGAVVVVATAGGIYYVSQSGSRVDESGKENKSKKDRRKKDLKGNAEEKVGKAQVGKMRWQYFELKSQNLLTDNPDARQASSAAIDNSLPVVDDATVESLTAEVFLLIAKSYLC